MCSGRTKKKQWGMTSRRRKRRDFDAVYYMEAHDRNGERKLPRPLCNSSTGYVLSNK